jgi:hypothetical protein
MKQELESKDVKNIDNNKKINNDKNDESKKINSDKNNEKIIKDFGLDFDSLKIVDFYKFAKQEIKDNKDNTSKGVFELGII